MSDNVSESSEIQAILENLQEEIRHHRLALGELGAFEQPDPLGAVRQHQWVNSHLPIGWPVMPKGIIPKLVAYAQKITRRLLRWYISPLVDQQNAYNAAVTEVLASLQTQSEEHTRRLGELHAKLRGQRQSLDAQRQSLDTATQRLQETTTQHRQALDTLMQHSEALDKQFNQLQDALAAGRRDRAHEREKTRVRIQRLETWHRKGRPKAEVSTALATVSSAPPLDYFLLGLQHRSEEQMAERLYDYDDLFTALSQAQERGTGPQGPVLDIGCGRGDLVAHLQGLGLQAYGIEIDRDAIQMAQGEGRDVREVDAFAHLQGLADDSLAAITLIQVIEHFEIGDLLRLFELAFEKLALGGVLVAETINPLCLVALANAYYLDPSHKTPLPPGMTKFLLEQAGFWKIETRFLRPVPEPTRLESLPTELGDWVQTLNTNTDKLNHVLYGPQDYAAIAHKPEG